MPRKREFDETEILTKAMELFWRKGYHATSIQDLVDHLGVNRASLYNTFGGKHELFEQAFEQYRSTNKQAILSFLNEQKSVVEGLRALFRTSVTQSVVDSEQKGCFVVNTTTELVPGDEVIRKKLNENRATFEKIFRDQLRKAAERGEISSENDFDALASMLFCYYNGLKVVTKLESDEQALNASVDAMLSAIS